MGIDVTFLKDGEDGQAVKVATQLAEFINTAKSSIHIAIYDFRLKKEELAGPVIEALNGKAAKGIEVQIAFYAGRPQGHQGHKSGGKGKPKAETAETAETAQPDMDFFTAVGGDPAPSGTEDFLKQVLKSDVQTKGITGSKLMHNKYIVRDANTSEAAIWTGSANFTDDAWSFQENNIVCIEGAPELYAYYQNDFKELWIGGDIKTTGVNDTGTVDVGQTTVDVAFAPGEGETIDQTISTLIGSARRRIKIASMVLTSHAILGSLDDALRSDQVSEFSGVYDETQMAHIVKQWQKSPNSAGIAQTFQEVASKLVGKHSQPYSPTSKHDFMHNKVAVCDDAVVTGSYNFSHSATQNAENIVILHSKELADKYSEYIDELTKRYKAGAKKK